MTTVEYEIINTILAGKVLSLIENKIPCFVFIQQTNTINVDVFVTISIKCRKEDAAFVEEMLAPFVSKE